MSNVPDFGEPWTEESFGNCGCEYSDSTTRLIASSYLVRACDCVNACRGFDPAEMRRSHVALLLQEKIGWGNRDDFVKDVIDTATKYAKNNPDVDLPELKLLD